MPCREAIIWLISPRKLWAVTERGISIQGRGTAKPEYVIIRNSALCVMWEIHIYDSVLLCQTCPSMCTLHVNYIPFSKRSCRDTSSCSHTSAASDIRATSMCGNLDSFGHLHKQAVSGLRRASLPKREADSWQGVATSQLSPIARPKGRDGDF